MIEADNPLGLMVWLINYIADRFGNSAILKGGMELRLLDCPRFTNDIDYVFVPYSSKKDVSKLVIAALHEVSGLKTEHSINSKCLRCRCEYNGMRAQIEINTATKCESQELTTAILAKATNQQGRIIRGMRFDVALAHKMAAWNERELVRDLFDCHFMAHVLDVRPHLPTLLERLGNSEIRTGSKTKKISMTIQEFVQKVQSALLNLSQAKAEEQMRDFLPPENLPGLEKTIRIGVNKLLLYLSDY